MRDWMNILAEAEAPKLSRSEIRKIESDARYLRVLAGEEAAKAAHAIASGKPEDFDGYMAQAAVFARRAGEKIKNLRDTLGVDYT